MSEKKISIDEKIFIAGSSGMVGGAVCRAFKKNGYGSHKLGGKILNPSRKDLDLSNLNEVDDWFIQERPTIVVLAAAKVGGILANSTKPAEFILKNLKIQTNVIETAWKYSVKRFLFLGSSCIYPKFAHQPIKEDFLLDGILESTNEPYAIAKIAGIKLCDALRLQYGFDAISLMPTNLYGPGDNYDDLDSHVMASLIKKFSLAVKNSSKEVICWGTGKPFREFMHVDDLGEAVVYVLENWDPNNSISPKNDLGKSLTYLNVGNGKDISIFELANKISNIAQFKGKIIWDNSKPDGVSKKLLNIERIISLGWAPKIPLDIGIEKTINDYQKYLNN